MHGAKFFKNSAGWTSSLERRFDLLNPYVVRPRNEQMPRADAGRTLTMAMPDPTTREAKCLNSGRANGNEIWKADKDPYDRDYRTQKNAALIAEMLCAGCPIKDWCLSEAMEDEGEVNDRNRYGVRGGLTPTGRYELMLSQRACPKAGHVGHMKMREEGPACLECKRISERERKARLRGDGDAA